MVRQCRALAAAFIVIGSVGVLDARPAAAVIEGFAGRCTASGSITFSSGIGTSPGAGSANFALSGSCTLVSKSNPLPHTTSFAVSGLVAGPVMSCEAGVMTGRLDFWVDGDRFKAETVVVNTAGVLSVTATSVMFSTVGEVIGATNACPLGGSWSGTFVVEDPTIDGVTDGSIS